MKILQVDEVDSEELLKAIDLLLIKRLTQHSLVSDVPQFLTRKQVKDQYGISYSSIHRYMAKGILTPNRIGGKVFFDSKSLTTAICPKVKTKA